MASWNLNVFATGMVFGTHDTGVIAWTIRWRTAGWANRDNLSVWGHAGLVDKYSSTQCYWVEMLDYMQRWDCRYRYINNPGDNPGITNMFLGKPFWSPDTAYSVPALLLRAAINSIINKTNYAYSTLILNLFGIKYYQNNRDYICNEMVFNLICGVERTLGLRVSGWPSTDLLRSAGQQWPRGNNFSEYVPVKWFDTSLGPYRAHMNVDTAVVTWNTAHILNVWSPHHLNIRRSRRTANWLASDFRTTYI